MRGLLLMGVALPQVDTDAIMQISIGHRDAWLLSLRETLFGAGIECLLPCPACGQSIELDFQVSDIRAAHALPRHVCEVNVGGKDLRFRLPTSADLLTIESERDAGAAETILLQRCWVGAAAAPDAEPPQPVADDVAAAVARAMSAADPQAEVLLELACPACGHATSQLFDIVGHLWCEFDHWARGLLQKVHAVASHYGWSEDCILGMSAERRRVYLNMIGTA
jgi:hypothetical protein